MQTEPKPLKEIIATLREEAGEYSLQRWRKGDSYSCNVQPPDILAVLDPLKAISDFAPDLRLPMEMLFQIAQTLTSSNNTEQDVIGGVLLQCHNEIKKLTEFCQNLVEMEVDYPIQDKKDDEE